VLAIIGSNLDRIHLFDPTTGRNLSREVSGD
jgi:hypothetical protein